MNVDKYIKRQILIYSAMTLIGVIALFLGYVMKIQTHSMSGIAFGFIPAGLGCLLVTLYARKKPDLHKNFVAESDERSIYIQNKSGAAAFWITFWWIFALTMFSSRLNINVTQLGVSTLIFMSILYFSMFFINLSKH
ncbi:MAG: hypothetical protein ABFD08_00205 [Syntrophomonas sp.]